MAIPRQEGAGPGAGAGECLGGGVHLGAAGLREEARHVGHAGRVEAALLEPVRRARRQQHQPLHTLLPRLLLCGEACRQPGRYGSTHRSSLGSCNRPVTLLPSQLRKYAKTNIRSADRRTGCQLPDRAPGVSPSVRCSPDTFMCNHG